MNDSFSFFKEMQAQAFTITDTWSYAENNFNVLFE